MPRIVLERFSTGKHGTFGRTVGLGSLHFTAELPWKGNKPNISCIPLGIYPCAVVHSAKFGPVYQVRDVPGRSHILIHAGNYAGDVARGFRTHSHGCILPGMHWGWLGDQRAVLASRTAVSEWMRCLNGKPFILEVKEKYACSTPLGPFAAVE